MAARSSFSHQYGRQAVNPTNIMGSFQDCTCEMEIQAFDHKVKEGKAWEIPQIFTHWMDEVVKNPEIEETLKNAKTEFVAVRFGNVLGRQRLRDSSFSKSRLRQAAR